MKFNLEEARILTVGEELEMFKQKSFEQDHIIDSIVECAPWEDCDDFDEGKCQSRCNDEICKAILNAKWYLRGCPD